MFEQWERARPGGAPVTVVDVGQGGGAGTAQPMPSMAAASPSAQPRASTLDEAVAAAWCD